MLVISRLWFLVSEILSIPLKPLVFEDYVRAHGLRQLNLYGDNRAIVPFHVYIKDAPSISTKIGDRWKQFCIDNNFHCHDKLRFRSIFSGGQSIIRVFKKKLNAV